MAYVTLHHPKLTLEGAEAVLKAAQAHADRMSVPMIIAIVDDGGYLMAFARMDGAKISSVDIAMAKAVSAAIRRQPTGPVMKGDEINILASLSLTVGSHARQISLRGGLPLVANAECVGAIGVSAGTEEQDLEVARAGVAALGA
jgi:glc operon protein GlcG